MSHRIPIGIIGSGTVAERRAQALLNHPSFELFAIAPGRDNFPPSQERARSIAQSYGCRHIPQWDRLAESPNIDALIIATAPVSHSQIALHALRFRKHLLIEKPITRSIGEAIAVLKNATQAECLVKVGFNHRYHPWVQKTRRWVLDGRIGKPLWIRAAIGHAGLLGAGRPNFSTSWFCDSDISGGGTLVDNGVHAHDTVSYLLGVQFDYVTGWNLNLTGRSQTPDNAAGVYKTADDSLLYIHQSSWSNWGPYFLLELSGTFGQISFDSSSGQVQYYSSTAAGSAVRETERFDPSLTRLSWTDELSEFASAIGENRQPVGSGVDGINALVMSKALELSSQIERVVPLAYWPRTVDWAVPPF